MVSNNELICKILRTMLIFDPKERPDFLKL